MRLLIIFAAILGCACAEKRTETAATPSDDGSETHAAPATDEAAVQEPQSTEAIIPPRRILDGTWDESLAVGQSLTVVGEFMRNDPQSNCAYAQATHAASPPKTSWDWLIRKDGRCMWVSRGPDPRGYNRIFGAPEEILDAANIGRKIEIEAVVAAKDDGRLYLTYTEGRALDR